MKEEAPLRGHLIGSTLLPTLYVMIWDVLGLHEGGEREIAGRVKAPSNYLIEILVCCPV